MTTHNRKYFSVNAQRKRSRIEKLIAWVILIILAAFFCVWLPLCSKAYAEPRPWTDDEKNMFVWGALGAGADMYNPNNYEVNPIIGEHPSPLTVITYIASEYLFSVIIAHFCPDITLPLIGKVNMREQILYNRASRYTANACWNARLDWR